MGTGTFCLSGHVIARAGVGVNLISGAYLIVTAGQAAVHSWIEEAESEINNLTKHNWTDDYATLSTDTKYILQGAAADYAAILTINADLTGDQLSRIEAEDRINILRDSYLRKLSILKDKKNQDFMENAT